MILVAFFVLLLILFLVVCLVSSPSKCWVDRATPFNLAMYREPRSIYSDQLVNLWIDKPWRSDGGRIPTRIEKSVNNRDKTLVIYSHGQAENLLSCVQFMQNLSSSLNVDTLCYDYSGYGLNPADSFERSEEGVNLTLRTIYESLTTEHGYRSANIIIWGYSLGSGPSVQLASSLSQTGYAPMGLVLFGAYSSMLAVVEDHTHARFAKLFSDRWNNAKIIHQVTSPILVMHGQSDGMISIKHSQTLKRANPNVRLVIMPNIGHTSFSWSASIQEVKTWLKSIQQ